MHWVCWPLLQTEISHICLEELEQEHRPIWAGLTELAGSMFHHVITRVNSAKLGAVGNISNGSQ